MVEYIDGMYSSQPTLLVPEDEIYPLGRCVEIFVGHRMKVGGKVRGTSRYPTRDWMLYGKKSRLHQHLTYYSSFKQAVDFLEL